MDTLELTGFDQRNPHSEVSQCRDSLNPGKWNQSQNDSKDDSGVLYKGNESEQEKDSLCDEKEKEYQQFHVAKRRKSITGILTGLHSSFDMADVEITSSKMDALVASETFVKKDKSLFSEEEDLKQNDVSNVSKEPIHDQISTTTNDSITSDQKAYSDANNGESTMDEENATEENRVNLTRTPSKRKVFAKARTFGDNMEVVDKALLRETPLSENQRCQTSLGMVGNEDHERSIQENINQSKSRSYTPGLPPIPHSKRTSTSRRNMRRIPVSPRVDLLMNSDLFRKNLENHQDLLDRHSIGYSLGMKKSVSNLDLSVPFDHEEKSDFENVKTLNLAREPSNLDPARTNSRRDENCSENNPSSEISSANSAEKRNKGVNSHRNPALKNSTRRYSLAIGAENSLDIHQQSSHSRGGMGRSCIPSFEEFKRLRKQKLSMSCSDTAMLDPRSPATLKNEISNLVFDFEHSLKHNSEDAKKLPEMLHELDVISEIDNRDNKENVNSNPAREFVKGHTSRLQSKATRKLDFVDSSKNQGQMDKHHLKQNEHDASLGNENKGKSRASSKRSPNITPEECTRLAENCVNGSSDTISSQKLILGDNTKETFTDSLSSKRTCNIGAENNTRDGFSLDIEERKETDLIDMNTSVAELSEKSLPVSKNLVNFKSEKCAGQKGGKHKFSFKKKLLSAISNGSDKKQEKFEILNSAKTCENSSIQQSVDIDTEVNEYIYSRPSASQKQGAVKLSDRYKGNNSSSTLNKKEYWESSSSLTEDVDSEVFSHTTAESITSSIQSIPDSLNTENIDKFQEFDDYEYESRQFGMKGSRDNGSPVLRSTSDACNATPEALQKRRERKERPYKSDPFTGLENLPAASGLSTGLRHHRSFASSSREEILSFLGNVTFDSSLTHHDSSPSLEELQEDDEEDESLPETAFEKERKGRNRLSSASIASTDSGVIGQDSQISPTSTLSVTHNSSWPDFQSQDLTHNPNKSVARSQSETTTHQKLIKCADCGQDKKPAYLDINLNTSHKGRLCKQCYQRKIERKETIQEIIDTEISYGRDLLILKNEFYNPMKTAGLLKPDQLDSIFLNLDELIHVNTQFTTKLKAAVQETNQNEDEDLQFINIGSLFLESSTMFLTFENYCVNQEQAPRLLEQYEKEKELLQIFLHVSQKENILLRRMHLKSFLMVPVQRIMKYPLLLDRLHKATPPCHNDKEAIREAKDKIEDILGHINAKTKSISTGILKLSHKGRASLKHYSLTEKMEISRVALDVLGWNRKDVCDIITSHLQMTQAQDHTWASKKCKNLKFSSVHGVLFTLGEQPSNDNNKKNLMFPRKSQVKQAAVVLIKEKNGKYQSVREPFMLEKCIVTVDPDYDEVFELLDWNKDPYLLKADTPKETNIWSQHLKQLIQDLGFWRRRRNALPNILLHIHPE